MQSLAGLSSVWAKEKKYKIARRYGNNLFNTSQYEDTLPKEIAFLREDAKYSHLLEPYTASKKLHAYLHSNNIIRQGQHCEASSKPKLDLIISAKLEILCCTKYQMKSEVTCPWAMGIWNASCKLMV